MYIIRNLTLAMGPIATWPAFAGAQGRLREERRAMSR